MFKFLHQVRIAIWEWLVEWYGIPIAIIILGLIGLFIWWIISYDNASSQDAAQECRQEQAFVISVTQNDPQDAKEAMSVYDEDCGGDN